MKKSLKVFHQKSLTRMAENRLRSETESRIEDLLIAAVIDIWLFESETCWIVNSTFFC